MFSSMYNGSIPGAHNVWTAWTTNIMKKKDELGFTAVAMVSTESDVMWYTGGFLPGHYEIETINKYFEADKNGNSRTKDTFKVERATYVVKCFPKDDKRHPEDGLQPRHLVAFNGKRHILIARSRSSYIIVKTEGCSGPEWQEKAFQWLDAFCQNLINNKY